MYSSSYYEFQNMQHMRHALKEKKVQLYKTKLTLVIKHYVRLFLPPKHVEF